MPFRADPTKEYYEILGLKESASSEEIRKAYRKLALHYHPDRNRGDARAEERFKAISEAYAVLTDPEKRRLFDLSRATGAGAGVGGQQQAEPWAYTAQEDILRDLLRNREAAAIFEELTREFQRMGFRFDDGFVRHMFLGGRGVVFGGVFFGGPFGRGKRMDALWAGGSFDRRGEEGRPIERPRESPGLFGWLGRALAGIGKVARLALGSGGRGADITEEFVVTAREAREGGRKHFRLVRNGAAEDILVTVPAGVKPGTKLRLRGKGLPGATGAPGDLYLRIQVSD